MGLEKKAWDGLKVTLQVDLTTIQKWKKNSETANSEKWKILISRRTMQLCSKGHISNN